jgi:hypothetical protein
MLIRGGPIRWSRHPLLCATAVCAHCAYVVVHAYCACVKLLTISCQLFMLL